MASRDLQKFYRPYLSDDEDDSEDDISSGEESSDTESSVSGGVSPAPISRIQKGDPPPPPMKNTLSTPVELHQPKTAFKSATNTTTIMINSRDRDTSVYGQPTFFSIRLPRTYRNVTSINVTQIKLLSSFYYFSNSKNNTSMQVAEYGRTNTVDGVTVINNKDVFIREGTYNADTLVTELNNQLNRTPIYNRISISDFISGFITTGNYGLLFNDPGDTTYNPLTGVFEALTAKSEIVARYFNTGTNIGIQYYTSDQCTVAYYYPILRDYTISQVKITTNAVVNPYLNTCTTYTVTPDKTYPELNYFLDSSGNNQYLNGTDYYDRIVYSFTGLDDPYILQVVSDPSNQALLEQYKADNTWDNFLVNQYVCNYDSTTGRLTIYSQYLNTSLVTTLNAQYQKIFTTELIAEGISPAQVPALQTTSENLNGVIADMYNYIQLNFTNFFGIPYGKYAAAFYKTLSNELYLYDASGRYGWTLTYTGSPQATNNIIDYPDAPAYWNNLKYESASGEFIDGDLYYPATVAPTRKTESIVLSPLPVPANGGSYTFTVQTGLAFKADNNVRVRSQVNSANTFDAVVVSYTSGSGVLVLGDISNINGAFYDNVAYTIFTSDLTQSASAVILSPSPAGSSGSLYVDAGLSLKVGNTLLIKNGVNQFTCRVSAYSSVSGLLGFNSTANITGTFAAAAIYTVYANDIGTTAALVISQPVIINPSAVVLSPALATAISLSVKPGLSLKVNNKVRVVDSNNSANNFNGTITSYSSTTGAIVLNTTTLSGAFSSLTIYTLSGTDIGITSSSVIINPTLGGSVTLTLGGGLNFQPGNYLLIANGLNTFNGYMTSYTPGTGVMIIDGILNKTGSFSSAAVYTVTTTDVSVVNWFDYSVDDNIYLKSAVLDVDGIIPKGQLMSKITAYNSLTGQLSLGSIRNIRGTFDTSTTYYVDQYIRYTYTIPVLTDASGYILLNGSNETTYGYQDISFNVLPTSYSKLRFKSRYRQTVFIETIPPYVDEIPQLPKLIETYYLDLSNTPLLFDSFGNCLLDAAAPDFYMYDVSQNLLDGPEYMRYPSGTGTGQTFMNFVRQQKPEYAPNQIPADGSLQIFFFRPHIFFEIKHNRYPIPSVKTKFLSDIYIEREDGLPFGTQLEAYWYRDRAAFMADVQYTLTGKSTDPFHWFIKQTITADTVSSVITTEFISDETSYLLVKTDAGQFTAISLRVFVLRHDPYGIYTYPLPFDYKRMPRGSSADPNYFANKSTPANNFPTPYPTLFNSKGFRNSYDLSGVSNNLLDYSVLTNDLSNYDPYSFTNNTTNQQTPLRFVFRYQSAAIGPPRNASSWSQFFFSTSTNVIFDSSGNTQYYNPTKAALEISNKVLPYTGISNEYVFTNWFRAGASTNLYNGSIDVPPEQTIATIPDTSGSPWSVFSPIEYNSYYPNYALYNQSPFVVCRNIGFTLNTDISYNNINTPVYTFAIEAPPPSPVPDPNVRFVIGDIVLVKNGSIGQFNGVVTLLTSGGTLSIGSVRDISGSFPRGDYTISRVGLPALSKIAVNTTLLNCSVYTFTIPTVAPFTIGDSVLIKNGSVGQFNGIVAQTTTGGTVTVGTFTNFLGSFPPNVTYTVKLLPGGSEVPTANATLTAPQNSSPSSGQIYLGPDTLGGGDNFTSIMAIPFLPTMGKYVLPTRVVIKFAYVQPVLYPLPTGERIRNKRTDGLYLTGTRTYNYTTYSSPAAYTGLSDLNYWDDHYLNNRRNVVLGIFRTRDIIGSNLSTISITNALCTMSLKKVSQVGQYSSSTDTAVKYTKTRSPEWGTFYVYERNESASSIWYPYREDISGSFTSGTLQTKWTAVTKTADGGGNIFMTNYSTARDLSAYYADVSNNSLCFIPFYPVLTSAEATAAATNTGIPFSKPLTDAASWSVGRFEGLSYTSQPFIPITRASVLSENPNVINPSTSVCVYDIADVSGGGVSVGENSTYMGSCGPICLGTVSNGIGPVTVKSPNYRRSGFTPTYFNIRVNIRMPDTFYNPITDTSAFGTAADVSNCTVDTQTFFYDLTNRPNSDFDDISGAWGAEVKTKFKMYNDDGGFNLLSYIPSVYLAKDSQYDVNVRGYVPTVKFLSGVRIMGKNWTEFGQVSLQGIIDEIADISNAGITVLADGRLANDAARIAKRYTSSYARALINFNDKFTGQFTMGRAYTNASYAGETFTSTGFGDFINKFINYNLEIEQSSTGISAAQNAASTAVRNFISAQYSGILPDYVLQRNRYTDSLTFSLQFLTQLKSNEYLRNYLLSFDQWGLGWNLGFDKIDTPYRTRHVTTTFIRILDDYIYLKLNDELNINNVDISEKENLSQSRETFGSSRRYYGKLLLNTFGNFAQTFIQPAKALPFPIPKVDKLTLQLVDAYNNKISNDDCEYSVVFEVTEQVDSIDTAGTLTKGT